MYLPATTSAAIDRQRRQCRVEQANLQTEAQERGACIFPAHAQIDESGDNLGRIDRGNDSAAQASRRDIGAIFLEHESRAAQIQF